MEQVKIHTRALLITGTIIPNSNFVTHTDINQRRQEYIDGLLFYSQQFPEDDLFFLENSSYDFNSDEEFQKLFKEKNILLMKFPVSDKFSQGKGYQEFEMLDKSIEKLASHYQCFIKITGRYKILNLKEITNTKCESMIADSQKIPKVTQTNVFCIDAEFYKTYIKGLYLNVNDAEGIYIEHLVYETLISKNSLRKTSLFSKNPIIKGFSGSYGGTLHRNKYKMMLRNSERKILKLLGIHQFIIEY